MVPVRLEELVVRARLLQVAMAKAQVVAPALVARLCPAKPPLEPQVQLRLQRQDHRVPDLEVQEAQAEYPVALVAPIQQRLDKPVLALTGLRQPVALPQLGLLLQAQAVHQLYQASPPGNHWDLHRRAARAHPALQSRRLLEALLPAS